MTEKELKQYRDMKSEIQDLERRIQEEHERDIPVVCGKVKGSMREFPYIEERISVEMDEPVEAEKAHKRIKKWENEKDVLFRRVEAIEQFIEGIEKSKTRNIFRMRFYDGMTQKEIAITVDKAQSWVSDTIKNYLVTD